MADKKFEVGGVCKCGNDTWRWRIEDTKLLLTCTECGEQAVFTVPYPMMDMTFQAVLEK